MKGMKMGWLLGVVVLLAVVACAKPTPTPTPPQPTATPTPTAVATPTPTATPIPPVAKPRGEVVIADDNVPPLTQLPFKDNAATVGGFGVFYGIYETIVQARREHAREPIAPEEYHGGIAESWEIADDLSSVTFKIRKGIPWHDPKYGEVTVEDVAWSFNNGLKEGSVMNGAEQLAPGMKAGWDIVDDSHVRMNFTPGGYDPTWALWIGDADSGTFGIVSKKAYDDLGEDKFMVTPIGTGPFKVVSWKPNDEMVAEAVEGHWRATPHVKTLRVVQIPELASKEAALKTGEVHIAQIPLKLLKGVVDAIGGKAIDIGTPRPYLIAFAGNYWARTCPTCPEKDVYRKRPGFKPDKDHPWIGDPDDPDRMESARKVRWAMSMAIDREKIIETLTGGYAKILYTYINMLPDDPHHKDEWIVPYDVAKAKEYLKEAGYPNGFKMSMWVAPDVQVAWDPEIGAAIAEMWRTNLGLDVSIENTVYAARRPSTVDSSIDIPFQHGVNWLPGQSGANMTCAQPGHHLGIELPDEICELGFKTDTELDLEKRIQITVEFQDYISRWQLYAVVLTTPVYWVYRPEVVQWTPFQVNMPSFNSAETIIMK